jgi:chorismate mutase
MVGDQDAAAKFHTAQPIDDPRREQQELDSVAAASPGMAINAAEERAVLPRGLLRRWRTRSGRITRDEFHDPLHPTSDTPKPN